MLEYGEAYWQAFFADGGVQAEAGKGEAPAGKGEAQAGKGTGGAQTGKGKGEAQTILNHQEPVDDAGAGGESEHDDEDYEHEASGRPPSPVVRRPGRRRRFAPGFYGEDRQAGMERGGGGGRGKA